MIRENNKIGDNVSIGTHSIIERDNKIGDGVRIHSNCFVPEFIDIRKKAWLGPGVTILNVLHPPCPKFEECAQGTVIGENSKIGGNVTIGPRITIGKNTLVGYGSVITKNIPNNAVAYGNPAIIHKDIKELKCILGDFDIPYEWEADNK
jgi:acetyltransferase-like isoleucine patch superfamily enzyme